MALGKHDALDLDPYAIHDARVARGAHVGNGGRSVRAFVISDKTHGTDAGIGEFRDCYRQERCRVPTDGHNRRDGHLLVSGDSGAQERPDARQGGIARTYRCRG